MTELECVSGQSTAARSAKTELNRTIEEMEAALKAKEDVRFAAITPRLLNRNFGSSRSFVSGDRSWSVSKQRCRVPTGFSPKETRSSTSYR